MLHPGFNGVSRVRVDIDRRPALARFADRPRYGYQLRNGFDTRTGGTWPLNVGQVYTTLAYR